MAFDFRKVPPITIEQRHRVMLQVFAIIAVVESETLRSAYLHELAEILSNIPIKR